MDAVVLFQQHRGNVFYFLENGELINKHRSELFTQGIRL